MRILVYYDIVNRNRVDSFICSLRNMLMKAVYTSYLKLYLRQIRALPSSLDLLKQSFVRYMLLR